MYYEYKAQACRAGIKKYQSTTKEAGEDLINILKEEIQVDCFTGQTGELIIRKRWTYQQAYSLQIRRTLTKCLSIGKVRETIG